MFAVIPFITRIEGKKEEENGECKNRALVVRKPSHEAFTSFYLYVEISLMSYTCTLYLFCLYYVEFLENCVIVCPYKNHSLAEL